MRQKAAIWSALLLARLLGMHQGLAQDAAGQDDPELQRVAPFQVFDNLYYVGARWVSAWLLETDQGLILFDSLYGDLVDIAVDGILELGFDPDDIRYVIVSHARYDHVGGARRFQQEFGAVVLMTEADWQMSEGEAELREYPRPMRHLSLGNGDTLNLGRTRLQFLQTPGTTPGVLSTIFTVYDSGFPHTAVLFGGAELDSADPDRPRTFIDSIDRLLAVPGVEVNVANHPEAGDVFARYEMLQERRDGDPHPFVDPESWTAWLELLRRDAQTRLDAGTAAN